MRICPNCNTENPTKATHCMKCGTLLVEEESLSVEEKLQRELSQAQDEIVLLKAALDTSLKSKAADLNNDIEKERDTLKEKNEYLSSLIVEMANKVKGLDDSLKSVSNELLSSKNFINKQQERIKELLAENNGKKKHFQWKILSIVLMILLFVCGCCFLWNALGNRNTEQYDVSENSSLVIDSLRLANRQLQASRDSILFAMQNESKSLNDKLDMLKEKCDSLKDINDKLNSNSMYEGHDAEYWYVQYRKEKSGCMYNGHDAKYWYDRRLYEKHDAKYWYEKYIGMLNPNK